MLISSMWMIWGWKWTKGSHSFDHCRIQRILETSKLNNWLNRSIDQSLHNRLHNEARYLDAKLAVKQKIQHDPQTEG